MRQKFLTMLLIGAIGAFPLALTADEVEDEAKLEELRENIKNLKEELEKTRSSRDKLLDDLEKTEKNMSELQEKADDLLLQIEESQARLQILKKEHKELAAKKKLNSAMLAST